MDSIDLEVLKTSAAWLAAGHRCELVTVIKTWGSSPRPVGATLAICDDGTVVGSVSGGCIEDDLIDTVRTHGIVRTLPDIVSYGISADEAHRFGLPCGGTIELAIEPLHADSRVAELLARLEAHELVERRLDLRSGAVTLHTAVPGAVQPDVSMLTGAAGIKPMPQELDVQADTLAIYLLARAGYNVDNAARFWQRLATQVPATVANGYTALHPGTNSRMAAINRAVTDVRAKQAAKKPLKP